MLLCVGLSNKIQINPKVGCGSKLVQRLLNISAVRRIIQPSKCGPVLRFLSNALTEQLDEAALTVGFVVLLFESAFVELFQAEGTDEVLRVELLGHGGDAAARDGLLTAGAEGAAPLVVVHLAVRLAVVLEEAAVHKRCEALLQRRENITCCS